MRYALGAMLSIMLVAPASGSYINAVEAYGAGDLATARREFEVMARLGHRTSQYNLATMLLKGEGGPAQPAEAFGWVTVAAEAGDKSAQNLLSKMTALATSRDQERASQLRAAYGVEASQNRLVQLTDDLGPLRSPWAKPPAIKYPRLAKQVMKEGWVVVEVQAGPAGEARDPRRVFAVNASVLEGAALAGVQTGLRQVDGPHGWPGQLGITSVTFNFEDNSVNILDRDRSETECGRTGAIDTTSKPQCETVLVSDRHLPQFPPGLAHWLLAATVTRERIDFLSGVTYTVDADGLEALCNRAKQGDPPSQALCGSLLMFERRVPKDGREFGYQMLVRAALAGQPDAALLVGAALMGTKEATARAEGLRWWEVAAQNGSSAARARVLDVWLREQPVAEATLVRARKWLELVAAADDDWAVKHAAAIWAAHPDDRVRDPGRALSLVPKLKDRAKVDPQVCEIEAAARAAAGDPSGAVKAQDRAIAGAKTMGWNTVEMAEQRARYERGGHWRGDLIRNEEASARSD